MIGWLVIPCFFLIRPTYLGENFSLIGVSLLVGLALLATFLGKVSRRGFEARLPFLLCVTLYLAFRAVEAPLTGAEDPFETYGLALGLAAALAAAAIFSNEAEETRFKQGFIWVLVVFSISAFVTYVLTFLVPLETMRLFAIPIKTYDGGRSVYFPFTLIYQEALNVYNGLERASPRASLFFRESGIAQAFLCWAVIVLMDQKGRSAKLKIVALVCGIIAVRSTAGFFVMVVTVALKLVTSRKITPRGLLIFLTCFAPLSLGALYIALYDPNIGLEQKSDTISYSDRRDAIASGLSLMAAEPLGDSRPRDVNANISLLANSGQIGVIGLALAMLPWLGSLQFERSRTAKAIAILPAFLTALLLQPIDNATDIYVWLSVTVSSLSVGGVRRTRMRPPLRGRSAVERTAR